MTDDSDTMINRLPPLPVTQHYEIVKSIWPCGCETGLVGETTYCEYMNNLRKGKLFELMVRHFAEQVPSYLVEARLSTYDSQDRSRVYGKEETAQEMLLRMCPPKVDL
jgi:hypothetical protein